MQGEAALDLDGRNVLAPGDDHVVHPAGDVEVAIGVGEAGIAGEVPAITKGLRVGFGAMPVALEGFVALGDDGDLALLARRGGSARSPPRGTTRTMVLRPARPAEPGLPAAS